MADYVTITDTEIEPEKPVTTSLWSRVRDNAIAIAEGALGAPRVKPVILWIQETVALGSHSPVVAVNRTSISRVMNTVQLNEIDGASLNVTTYRITLPAGKYDVDGYGIGRGCAATRVQLYNISDAVVQLSGGVNLVSTEGAPALLKGRFTIAATKVFEFRQAFNTTNATVGGRDGDFAAQDNVAYNTFAELIITKVG
jgi:hypothetical protein